MRSQKIAVFSLVASAVVLASPVHAQEFPTKEITMVVPYAAGGPADLGARVVAEKLKKYMGVPVLVDNKPGAGATLGSNFVSRAPKDGHTVLFVSASVMVLVPHLNSNPNFDASSLTGVSIVSTIPVVVAVKKEIPVKTPAELISYLKAHPETRYGNTGNGTFGHLMGQLLNQVEGLRLISVPYKGTTPMLNDLLGGHIDVIIDGGATTLPFHQSGALRVVGTFGAERFSVFPDVMTFKESGFPKLVSEPWLGVLVPVGTPSVVTQKLNQAIRRAVSERDVVEKLGAAGLSPAGSSVEEMSASITREHDLWGEVIKKAGITQDGP